MQNNLGSIGLEIILLIVLILINAFFAASEMAIVSVNKTRIQMLAEKRDKKALLLQKLLSETGRFLATIQVGITLAGFLASAAAATTISEKLEEQIVKLNIPGSSQIAVIVVTILLSYITLVFGELVPKRIALQNSEALALNVAHPISIISKITVPFVKLLTLSSNLVLKLLGKEVKDLEEKVSEEEIRSLIQVGEENGVINKIEKDMIDSIFKFDDTLVKNIMTPEVNVFSIDADTEVSELIEMVLEEQYSRIPVYEDDINNIIGILYMKDLFYECRKKQPEDINIREILRPAYFVPETKNIDTLFKELQATKNHMAVVIDEYGGFSGLATIEDVIEEVMGNIFDEYDVIEESISKVDDETYIVDGTTSIDDVNEAFEIDIPSDDYDTVGGFVTDLLGRIPADEDKGRSFKYKNCVFCIDKVTDRRIEKLRITKKLET